MKKVLILAAAALALAACAKQQEIPAEETQPMAVGFDAYLNRAVTKAISQPTTATSTTTLLTSGFGIFAYYTDNENYSGSSIPNFMYNQEVNTAAWTYSPVKYWPNEYGDKAIAEESDRISFFAYGPYKAAEIATGKVTPATTKGIIGFTRNNYSGDPLVKYVVDMNPASSLDLVWGRQPASNAFEAFDGTTYDQEGLPWLNVRRPKYSADGKEKVKFQFDHALAALNVQIDAFVDGTTASTALDTKTNIFVRSITFTGFATEGALNLNNIAATGSTGTKVGTALWESFNGDNLVTGEEVTIYDGRKDGREGTTAASNEKVTGLNPVIVQKGVYHSTSPLTIPNHAGVTNTAVNLFDSDTETAPIYVIPTGDEVTVTIAYDVETADDNLATYLSDGSVHGSSISNVITKAVMVSTTPMVLMNGNVYTIKLHLGMNSVKIDAAVTEWAEGGSAEVDLPANN